MKIAIMGFGIVGSGVAELLANKQDHFKKMGNPITIAHILDLREFPDSPFAGVMTKSFEDILNDPEVEVVAELMGGVKPAYEYTKALLQSGKHVVSSNKELVIKCGAELMQVAADNGAGYMFEASVGGGVPIIRPLTTCLAANEITGIVGILNGTTNYILTQMAKNGETFENALKSAQEKGYAEKDPTADVEGIDAARKIAILASIATGRTVDSDSLPVKGITAITPEDVKQAEASGCVIKLLGMCVKENGTVSISVQPVTLAKSHPLAGVDDVFNGIMVTGDAVGDVMFYGRGAGKSPTASAVVADMIDISKNKGSNFKVLWK